MKLGKDWNEDQFDLPPSWPYEQVMKKQMNIREELEILSDESRNAIHQALLDGRKHGYTTEWKHQTAVEHVNHAFEHCRGFLWSYKREEVIEHLQHGICRLTMALIRIKEAYNEADKQTEKTNAKANTDNS